MIPLKAEKRRRSLPLTTATLVIACVAVLLRLVTMADGRATAIFDALAVVPSRLLATPFDPTQVLTVLTAAFLHAGWVHLGGNMLYLCVFGPNVEARLGHWRFLGIYLFSAIAGALAFALTHAESGTPLVGASAAIAGVLGAHLVLEPRARVTTLIPVPPLFEVASLPAGFVVAAWFALQLASTLAPVAPQASVAFIAHVAGFLAGAVIAAPVALLDAWRDSRSRARSRGKREGQTRRRAA